MKPKFYPGGLVLLLLILILTPIVIYGSKLMVLELKKMFGLPISIGVVIVLWVMVGHVMMKEKLW